jgi:hypothetical protein
MRSQSFTLLINDENFVEIIPEDVRAGALLHEECRKEHCEI